MATVATYYCCPFLKTICRNPNKSEKNKLCGDKIDNAERGQRCVEFSRCKHDAILGERKLNTPVKER